MYVKDDNYNGALWIYNLDRGTTYYFWCRTHNAKGWSDWSSRTSAKTHDYPPAPTIPTMTEVTQSSFKANFSSNGDGGSPVLEWQIGYAPGSAATSPTASVSGKTGTVVKGLPGGETFTVFTRGRNIYGWGKWSAGRAVTLVAGAWVDVKGVKKRAVPYVRYKGVWYPAEGWAKIAGLWKGTG